MTGRHRWRPSRRAVIVLAFLLSALGVFWGLRHAGRALVITKDIGPPDAIVMLASHEWERLPAAAALARQYPSSVVVLTVPVAVSKWNCHLCADRAAWLQHEGVAAGRIIELPDRVANTRDEALVVSRFVGARQMKAVMVVTSPYHTRRALGVFEHAMRGSDVRTGILPATATSIAVPDRWWGQAYDRWYVTYEWAALVYYRVKFRVPLA